jgi:hypothetical protein
MNAKEEVDADVDETEATEGVIDVMDMLRLYRGVAPGDGGVGVGSACRN